MSSRLDFGRVPTPDGVNGWWEMLPAARNALQVEGDSSFDWVVIGGGITGLCAARRLAERAPEASIALVEADRIGRGTAGRNSGFFVDLPHDISSESYSRSVDADKADIRLQRHGIDYVRSAVIEHGIDCDWRDDGKYHAAVNKRGMAALEHFAAGLDRIGESYQWLDEAGIGGVTGSAFYKSAILTPGCSTVQPAALMRGLAAALPENVTVFESSAVKESDEVARLGGQSSWALIPADPVGSTVRRLVSDRICVRNHFAFRPDVSISQTDLLKAKALHQRSFDRRFPMLGDVEFEYTWGGALCLSANSGTLFGKRDDGVFQALGCNGLGLSRGSAAGKLIAEHALGESNALIEQVLRYPHPRPLPGRPISDLAVSTAIWFKELSAGAEL
jgi:glycine/D-amino acid oxidase-like deaminating enzyme